MSQSENWKLANSGLYVLLHFKCPSDDNLPIFSFQIGYEFNVAVNGAWPSFVVNPLVFKATSPNQLKVSVCTHYIQDGSDTSSNMAVMEVNLPSGFTTDKDSLPALRRFKGVKRVDSLLGDTKVSLLILQTNYFLLGCYVIRILIFFIILRWCSTLKNLGVPKYVPRYLHSKPQEWPTKKRPQFWCTISMTNQDVRGMK